MFVNPKHVIIVIANSFWVIWSLIGLCWKPWGHLEGVRNFLRICFGFYSRFHIRMDKNVRCFLNIH